MVKNLLTQLKNLQQMQQRLLQKEQFKKQPKQLEIYLAIKLLIRLQVHQKNHAMKNHYQLRSIKKYQKKDIYLQKKDNKLLMN